jgi:hypothetical protein
MTGAPRSRRHLRCLALVVGLLGAPACDRGRDAERAAIHRAQEELGPGYRAVCVSRVRDGYIITFRQDEPEQRHSGTRLLYLDIRPVSGRRRS